MKIETILDKFEDQEIEYLEEVLDGLVKGKPTCNIVEWAEKERWLPEEITERPGFFDWKLCPHFIEPALHLSPDKPTQRIIVCKGVQVAATTALVENDIGFSMRHDPCGIMMLREERDAAEIAMELRVDRMIELSNLKDLIYKSDGKNEKAINRKTFKRFPGGFIQAIGARRANKARSLPIKKLLRDEIDAYPDKTEDAEKGNILTLTENRTNTFEHTKKILDLSTPLKMHNSKIWKLLLQTDFNKRFVPCPHCGEYQELIWLDKEKDTGFFFEPDKDFNLIPNSTYYKCIKCKGHIRESHKYKMMNAGEWRPSQKASLHLSKGYFIPSWYSLFESWDKIARDWIQAVKEKDYEQFHNLRMALPWEDAEETPKPEMLKGKQRNYIPGVVPNSIAIKDGNGPILLLTCSVDVHKNIKNSNGRLDVEILGHCRNGSTYSIKWERFEGDTEAYWFREFSAAYQADPEALAQNTWFRLRNEILAEIFISDDGKEYPIRLCGVDTSYEHYLVQTFCKTLGLGVVPLMGTNKFFDSIHYMKETKGDHGIYYRIMVDKYKDRLAAQMTLKWTGQPMPQPNGYLNYPHGAGYDQEYFNMYGGEHKLKLYDERSGRFKGTIWKKKYDKAPNHAWDCRVYNMALLDIFVYQFCQALETDGLDYKTVFDALQASLGY